MEQSIDSKRIKRIAINTGRGDAPGLKAVIRAATLAGVEQGWGGYMAFATATGDF